MSTNPPYQPPPPYGAPTAAQPGPPPPPPFAPPSGNPADPPRVSPPPPPGVAPQPVKASPVAALIPLAGLMAVIGAFLPWFTPEISGNGQSQAFDKSLYSWKDGKIGLLPPIVLAVLSVSVIGLLMGKAARGRFSGSADPVKSVAKVSIGAGIGTGVCCVIAWFFVTSQFKFDGMSWDSTETLAKSRGYELGRGPQFGYFLTIAAGVVALIGGVLMLVMSKGKDAASQTVGFTAPPQAGFGQPQAYPPPTGFQPGQPQGHPQQPQGHPQQPQGYPQQPQQFGQQPGAYPPPNQPPNQPPSLYKPPTG